MITNIEHPNPDLLNDRRTLSWPGKGQSLSFRQTTWQYSKSEEHIYFTDGTDTFCFKGRLNSGLLVKIPSVPLPDFYAGSTEKGKAQIHKLTDTMCYFTIQDGRRNATYTLSYQNGDIWTVKIKPARKTTPAK